MNPFKFFLQIWVIFSYKFHISDSKLPMAINISSYSYVDFKLVNYSNIIFPAFGTTLNFKIEPDLSRVFLTTKVFVYEDNKIKKFYVKNFIPHERIIFKGYLEEIASPYVPGSFADVGIFYSLADVNELKQTEYVSCKVLNTEYEKSYNHLAFSDDNYSKLQNTAPQRSSRICTLEILVDHTYFQYMKSDKQSVLLEVLHLINIANSIFKESDVDGSGKSDVIEFLIDQITIFEERIQIAYPYSDQSSDSPGFIQKLKQYKSPYCLLIYFTHKDFDKRKLCTNFKLGRICPNYESKRRAHNVLFVTNVVKGREIPRYRMALTLLHHLGHAFGCKHDPVNGSVCTSSQVYTNDSKYIMEPEYTSGAHINNWKFSICCLKSMKKFIKRKESCLKKVFKSSCENGVVEKGESCDCNPAEKTCTNTSLCCHNKHHPMRCTLKTGAYCTFGTDECCNYKCAKVPFKEYKPCFSNKPCWNVSSICDGYSPFCPAQMQPDGISCLNNRGICIKGKCDTDICKVKGLQSCQCSSRHTECYVCCKNKSSECLPATSFEIFTPTSDPYVKKNDTSCDNNYGLCLSNGTCKRKDIFIRHSLAEYLYVLPFVGIILIAIGCFVSQQEKRPSIVDLARRHKNKKRSRRRRKQKRNNT
ncbi:disintegrin and metalloproteinase domain-containing protein 10-like isoform X2 [Centruroides sculpturatus]|uniref:disintegrin and metalloproteinase domain-containing protein 10-like isoform X2 n=1 Tax=Centruroides sculpturatus TaxID=218467 RepID=UPI000C6E9F15|nr:disintegrin and metalloproteinase domain-containing protein 10-like isoform X2 [Centruroides sculpturatus]